MSGLLAPILPVCFHNVTRPVTDKKRYFKALKIHKTVVSKLCYLCVIISLLYAELIAVIPYVELFTKWRDTVCYISGVHFGTFSGHRETSSGLRKMAVRCQTKRP